MLLLKLYKLGIINSYSLLSSSKYIKLYPTYFQQLPYSSSIRSISRGLKSFSISIKGLHLLKQSLGSTLVLIETPKGILTLAESLKKNVSGKIILIVN